MSDSSAGTEEIGHFKCPCATCILVEARKYEEKKQYSKADLIIKNALQYHSGMAKQLDEELKKFHFRTKYQTSNAQDMVTSSDRVQESIQFTHCQRLTCQSDIKMKEFTCPVAIFDRNPDPKQKPMYPKSVVYLEGNDHQLEEIRAARYWMNSQSKSSLEDEKIPNNVKKIISSEEFISFVKSGADEQGKNPLDITNVIEHVHSPRTKLKLPRCPTEIENIDPSAPEILNSVKDSTEPVPKITSEKRAVVGGSSLPTGHQISSSSKTTQNIPTLSGRNQTSRLKNVEEADTSRRNIESSTTDPAVVPNESTNCNSSEDAPLKSRISPTITFANSKDGVDATSLEKSASVVSTSKQPIASTDILRKATSERSKIPTMKKFASNMEQYGTQASHQEAVTPICSQTFIVGKPNPSEMNVTKPHDDVVAEQNPSETYVIKQFDINKETLTLVQDDDDDEDELGTIPRRRTSQFFQPSDVDSSATEAFFTALPCSTPNKRMSQFFKPSTVDTNEDVHSMVPSAPLANLSTITEMSKEHSSASRPSQKTPLETINEAEQSDECSKNDSVEAIKDPFDTDLIKRLLEKIEFPRSEHRDGYNQINSDMAQLKLSSVVKLGNSKYNIVGEIGKGNYARIFKLQDVKKSSKLVALKQQKPACPWEFYISKEIQRRLRTNLEKSYFIEYTEVFVYRNGSVMVSEWAPYGSVLSFVNNLKISPFHNNRCPMAVAIWLSIQFVEAIHYLHCCNIIHGDVKPDNFVLCDEIATDHPSVKLIDYGRAIDMSLLPKNVTFNKVVTTEDFTCNEMKDNRPWTYQTDLFGLASTIYVLLVGEYMKTKKETNKKWTLHKNFPRYINRDLWNPIFDHLLNIPSCTELPDLVAIRQTLEADFNSLDRQTITQHFTNIGTLWKK